MSEGGCSKSGPQFFKVLLGDFSERLRIPPAFVKHIVMNPSQRARLKGPSGRIWHVELSRTDSDTYLQDGWKKFVEDHSLEIGNFILFRYDGSGDFTVSIFDKTACEIGEKITCNARQESFLHSGSKKGESTETTSSDFEHYSQDEFYGSNRENPQKDYVHSPQRNRTDSTQREKITCNARQESFLHSGSEKGESTKTTSSDFEHYSQHEFYGSNRKNPQKDYVHSPQRNSTDSTQRKHEPTVKINRFKKCKTEDDELHMSETCSYSKKVCHIREKKPSRTGERTKALEKADAFSKASKFPNFLKIMIRSNVGSRSMLCIPAYFLGDHLPKQRTTILLRDPKGRAWEVTFIVDDCRSHLSGGWSAFSVGNNLKEGDVCIFEVVDECQMQMHIFPSETSPSTSQNV